MYKLTNHAYDRFIERVDMKGKERHHAENWVNQAMETAVFIGNGMNDTKKYRFKNYFLLVNTETKCVVTISHYNDFNGLTFKEEVKRTVTNKLESMAKPYRRMHRELLIKMHEAEIRKLRVFNPKTQAIIERGITEIKNQISDVESKLHDIEELSKKYGI